MTATVHSVHRGRIPYPSYRRLFSAVLLLQPPSSTMPYRHPQQCLTCSGFSFYGLWGLVFFPRLNLRCFRKAVIAGGEFLPSQALPEDAGHCGKEPALIAVFVFA